MARRSSSRHTRPTGRGALKAAYELLQGDVAHLRATSYDDHLELVRLSALVEGLLAHLQQLSVELAEVRRHLQLARVEPVERGPEVEALALHVADLRVTVATQQQMLSALTARLIEVMGRLEVPEDVVAPAPVAVTAPEAAVEAVTEAAVPEEAVAAAAPEAPITAAEAPSPSRDGYVAGLARAAAPSPAPAPAAPVHTAAPLGMPGSTAHAPYPAPAQARTEPVLVGAAAAGSVSSDQGPDIHVDITSPAVAPPAHDVLDADAPQPAYAAAPVANGARSGSGSRGFLRSSSSSSSDKDAPLDDETVLRLRLIRESFGR